MEKQRRISKGEEYLDMYPKFKKWINECVCCHRRGYKSDIPDQITVVEGNMGSYYIKKYFQPLTLDENGYCEVCAKLKKNNSEK